MSRQTSLEGEGGTLMKLITPGGMCRSDVASVAARVYCSRKSRAPYMARRAGGSQRRGLLPFMLPVVTSPASLPPGCHPKQSSNRLTTG